MWLCNIIHSSVGEQIVSQKITMEDNKGTLPDELERFSRPEQQRSMAAIPPHPEGVQRNEEGEDTITSAVEQPAFQASPIHHRGNGEERLQYNSSKDDKKDTCAEADNTMSELSWRKRLQSTLYQRNHEQELLQRAFESSRIKSNELILIHGPSGVGKTRLAKSLQPLLSKNEGYFILGKFDQLRRAAPYPAFVHAFTDFTQQVKDRGPEEIESVRQAIVNAIGAETSVLTGMIPALEQVLGSPESNNERVNTGDALQRFVVVFRMFIRSLCSPEKPLLLVLDDLQYADLCSLDLLYSIASDAENKGLVLLATCDDSVHPDAYLTNKLRDLESRGDSRIVKIPLSVFSKQQVRGIVGDVFSLNENDSTFMSELAYNQTQGNIFYLIEYLTRLHQNNILMWNPNDVRWVVHKEEAKTTWMSGSSKSFDNLLDIMKGLPSRHQDVLKVSACLGSIINEKFLSFVLDFELFEVLEDLWRRGFLWKAGPSFPYEFDHDIIQNAAYCLIPQPERELFHLEIGRRTWRKLSNEELDSNLFLVLSQMKIRQNLIKREHEQNAIATLCLHAGRKAARASTFRTAAVYLDFGLMLMDETRWRSNYNLMLALHNALAEMEMCRANFDRMHETIFEILTHARVFDDKHQAHMTMIYALSTQDKLHEAVDLGLEVLDALGERIETGRLERLNLLLEYRRVSRLLKGKSDEQLLRSKAMADETKLHALQIINMIILPSLLERPNLAPFILLRSIKITLEHGLSILSSSAFSVYAMFCINAGAKIREANRFADLALRLLKNYKSLEYLPRVYAAVYGCVRVWSYPVTDTLGPLLEAHRVGAQTGDFEFAGLCANQYCFNAMDAGVPLDEICNRWEGFHEILSANKQDALLKMAMPSVQLVHIYMGVAGDPLNPNPTALDYDKALAAATNRGEKSTVISIKYCRMIVFYMFGDYEKAFSFRPSVKEIYLMPPSLEQSSSMFYLGMVQIEALRQKFPGKSLRTFKLALKCLKRWSRQCPHNFVDKVFLLEAELASLQKRDDVAFEKYICAICMAKSNKFPHVCGLANERLGWHFKRIGETASARKYLTDARAWYSDWKAHALVERVDNLIQNFL